VEPLASPLLLLTAGFLAGAVSVVSLLLLVAGWLATSVAPSLSTESWEPSPIPGTGSATPSDAKITSAPSLSGFDDARGTSPGMGDLSPSSGSSNSKPEALRTSTFSAPIGSITDGSPRPGLLSSLTERIGRIWRRARASKRSVEGGTVAAHTPESTPGSRNKSNCRLCSRIRGWVAGGEYSDAERSWQLPPELARGPLSAHKGGKRSKRSGNTSKPRKGQGERAGSGSKRRGFISGATDKQKPQPSNTTGPSTE
jgi:hypothetical protein